MKQSQATETSNSRGWQTGGRSKKNSGGVGKTHDEIRPYQLNDGRWQAKKTLTVGGRKVQYTATATTKGEAQKRLIVKLELGEQPKTHANATNTIDALLYAHLDDLSSGDFPIAPGTISTYKDLYLTMLRPCYGLTGTTLDELTTEKIAEFRKLLTTEPTPKTGKPLGPTRRKGIDTRLKSALDFAVDTKRLTVNPFPKQLGKTKGRAYSKQVANDELAEMEAKIIAQRLKYYPQIIFRYLSDHATTDDAHTDLWLFLLSFYGLRPAEARGITLDNIHLSGSNPRIEIKQQLNRDRQIVPATKTEAGQRTIPLYKPLKQVAEKQVEIAKRLNVKVGGKVLLATYKQQPVRQQDHSIAWRKVLAAVASVEPLWEPRLRLYANRHIAATILELKAIPYPVIAKVMGWGSQSGTMLDVYSHVQQSKEFYDEIKAAVRIVGDYILAEPQEEKAIWELPKTIATQSEKAALVKQLKQSRR